MSVSSIVAVTNGTIAARTLNPAITVRRVYPFGPGSQEVPSDLPCWLNDPTLISVVRQDATWRILTWDVRMQLLIAPLPTPDRWWAQSVATAFMQVALNAFDLDGGLGGTVNNASMRGGIPTMGELPYGGKEFLGIELFLTLEQKDAVSI